MVDIIAYRRLSVAGVYTGTDPDDLPEGVYWLPAHEMAPGIDEELVWHAHRYTSHRIGSGAAWLRFVAALDPDVFPELHKAGCNWTIGEVMSRDMLERLTVFPPRLDDPDIRYIYDRLREAFTLASKGGAVVLG